MSETLQQRYDRWKARAIALLPKGDAWPRISGASLPDVVGAASAEFARVEASTDIYRTEMDPSQTDALLPEWERALSLPDACGSPTTDDGRRGAVVARLTGGGTNNRSAIEAAVAAFAANTELTDVVWHSQFEVGTDGATMGSPIGSDAWAATVTLEITTSDPDLDTAGLECVLNGLRRGHALFLFEYVTPPYAASLQLWLDPSSPDTTVEAGVVTVLGDRSTNGRHFTQATSTRAPAYTASDDDFGGRPTLTFDGVDDYLLSTAAFSTGPSGACTVYVVAKTENTHTGYIYGAGSATANANVWRVGGDIEYRYKLGGTARRYRLATVGDVPARLVGVFDGNTVGDLVPAEFLDGVKNTGSAGTVGTLAASGIGSATHAVGAFGNGASSFLDGTVAEILVYDGVHSDVQVAAVDAWLAARHGL